MHMWVRATVTTALAVTCLDGQAKVADKCIQTLEARPTRPDASNPRPCPLAIGYLTHPKAASARSHLRVPTDERLSRRAPAVEAASADADPIDETPALHV